MTSENEISDLYISHHEVAITLYHLYILSKGNENFEQWCRSRIEKERNHGKDV